MKKTLLTTLLSMAAIGAFAQGSVVFNNHVAGTIATRIYAPDTVTPNVSFYGNTAGDTPAGAQVYTGALLGGASGAAGTPINYTFGNNFSVQLMAAPGLNDSISTLLPVSQYLTTMRTTSSGAGIWLPPTYPSGDPGIPNTSGAAATVAVAAWYNAGGTVTSYSAAVAAQLPSGESPAFNLSALGEPAGAGPSTPAENLIGLQSFSLATSVPEPGTIALGVMGLSALLIRRRK